ncbi:MAG: IPT/TIG domain-containing protein [Deltaproteobacteria bacterium]|nr:IPT/TIG domain-containing protein [Deltaproteobacteria bacterium]
MTRRSRALLLSIAAALGLGATGCTGPTVTSIEPGAAAVGESVTITGSHFGTTQGPSIVRFNGLAPGLP